MERSRRAQRHERILVLYYCFISLCAGLLMIRPTRGFRPVDTSSIVGRRRNGVSQLHVSSSQNTPSNGNDASFEDEERRMALVRYIQQSFYANTVDDYVFEGPSVANGGLLRNLPLWRVPWVELPGRTNVLNVHEAVYTNMFEGLLRSGKDFYFGHLFLEQGTKNLKSYPVQAWHNNADAEKVSSSIGTLMRISDYRRLRNGRLLLLVQAMERFVVTNAATQLPYARADVQLLPDLDQWVETDTITDDAWKTTSNLSTMARSQALVDAFKWHPYEYEDTTFQSLPPQPGPEDVVGSVLAQVLPYASLDPTRLPTEPFWPPGLTDEKPSTGRKNTVASSSPSLEIQLLKAGVLESFSPPETTRNCSLAELELRVWWALNDYLLLTKSPVSPVLLGFLPPGVTWPPDFILHTITQELLKLLAKPKGKLATSSTTTTAFQQKYVPVAASYPTILRQRKLSFHVAAVVLRQPAEAGVLLQLPTTASRLQYLLWKLEAATASFQ